MIMFKVFFEFCLISILVILTIAFAGNTDLAHATGEVTLFLLLPLTILFQNNFANGVRKISENPATKFFLAILLISLLHGAAWLNLSIYPAYSISSARTLVSCFYAFLLSVLLLNERSAIIRFCVFLMIFGALEAGIGLSQAFSGRNTLFGIITLPKDWRAYGTFYNSDHFAAFLEMCFFTSLGILMSILPSSERFLHWRDRVHSLKGKEKNIFALISLCLLLLFLGIVFTKSRMGIISTFSALALFVIFFIQKKRMSAHKRQITYLIAIFIITALWLGIDPIIERFKLAGSDLLDLEKGSRGALWTASVRTIKDAPLLGSGIGTYRFVFTEHQPAHLRALFTHAHNDYIEVAVEFGITGLLLLLAGGIYYFRRTFKIWRERHNAWARGLGLGIAGGIFSVALHSGGDFVLRSYSNGILFSMLLGIGYNAITMEKHGE